MLTTQSLRDHKREHKCRHYRLCDNKCEHKFWQYRNYVIISVNTIADNAGSM